MLRDRYPYWEASTAAADPGTSTALREIYLEGFRIAVQEAQPWTVMSSYNLIIDVYASESHDLLTKVLRDDWGFKGLIVSFTRWNADAFRDVFWSAKLGRKTVKSTRNQFDVLVAFLF